MGDGSPAPAIACGAGSSAPTRASGAGSSAPTSALNPPLQEPQVLARLLLLQEPQVLARLLGEWICARGKMALYAAIANNSRAAAAAAIANSSSSGSCSSGGSGRCHACHIWALGSSATPARSPVVPPRTAANGTQGEAQEPLGGPEGGPPQERQAQARPQSQGRDEEVGSSARTPFNPGHVGLSWFGRFGSCWVILARPFWGHVG